MVVVDTWLESISDDWVRVALSRSYKIAFVLLLNPCVMLSNLPASQQSLEDLHDAFESRHNCHSSSGFRDFTQNLSQFKPKQGIHPILELKALIVFIQVQKFNLNSY